MTQSRAIVNKNDKKRLEPHLASSAMYTAVHAIRAFLESARAVPPAQVPPDIVTMNSRVLVRDPRDDSVDCYLLAYPTEDGANGETLSVLSPLGSVLLGAREGEQVTLMGARGARNVRVDVIEYQPERAGDYDL